VDQFHIIFVVAAGAVVGGVILFSWFQIRRLGARVRRLENTGSALAARPVVAGSAAAARVRLAVRPETDIAAPGDFLVHGLDSSGYVPVESVNGFRGHLVVLVLRLTNLGRGELLIRRPHIVFRLGTGASKLEPPATVARLGRLSFFDAQAAGRPLDDLKGQLLERATDTRSLNRNVVQLRPFEPVVSYAAFLPRRLGGLPVFSDDLLDFGVGFYSAESWHEYGGFWARPFRGLAVTYHG
jgi:hypothetical protein